MEIDIDTKFDNPEHELFMFNVLLGRSSMSKLFAYYGDNSICSALVASMIFNSYADMYEDETESYREMAK